MSDDLFGLFVAGPILVGIGLWLYFTFRSPKPRPGSAESAPSSPDPGVSIPPAAEPSDTPSEADQVTAQTAVPQAVSAHAGNFDRDMYIDDMTEEQLQDEWSYRTIYLLVWWLAQSARLDRDKTTGQVAEKVLGRPADRQLIGLSEYYAETVYESMMSQGEDLYWHDELRPQGDTLNDQQKGEVLLGGFICGAILERVIEEGKVRADDGIVGIMRHALVGLEAVAADWTGAGSVVLINALKQQAAMIASDMELQHF